MLNVFSGKHKVFIMFSVPGLEFRVATPTLNHEPQTRNFETLKLGTKVLYLHPQKPHI